MATEIEGNEPRNPANTGLRIVRVKRKRNTDAPDDLIIQDLSAPKQQKTSNLSDALGGMGLGAGNAPESPTTTTATTTATSRAPKRFRRMITMTAEQMLENGPDKLKEILLDVAHTKQEIPPSENSTDGAATQAARYQQIRRKRGLTNFEVTESAPDPLRGVADHLYDVVAVPAQAKVEGNNGSAPTGAEDTAMFCNFLPMVREYLDGTPVADTEMEYVYDVYIEEQEEEEGGEGGGVDDTDENTKEKEAWELHRRGAAPIVHILDDGTWVVEVASDQEDSMGGGGGESEDSNAEDYYANDYPDEGEGWSSDDDSLGGDWLCGGGRRGDDDGY